MANTLNHDEFAQMDAFDILRYSLYAGAIAADPTAYGRVISTQPLRTAVGTDANVLSGTRYIEVPLYSAFTVHTADCSTETTPNDIVRTNKEIALETRYVHFELCTDELIGFSPSEFQDLLNKVQVALLNQVDLDAVTVMLADAGGTAYGTGNTPITTPATFAPLHQAIAVANGFKASPNDPIIVYSSHKLFAEVQSVTGADVRYVGGLQTLQNVSGATFVLSSNIAAVATTTTNYVYPLSALGIGFPSNWREAAQVIVEPNAGKMSFEWGIGLIYGTTVLNPLAVQTFLN